MNVYILDYRYGGMCIVVATDKEEAILVANKPYGVNFHGWMNPELYDKLSSNVTEAQVIETYIFSE